MAGPAVTVSLAPSMPLGRPGRVLPVLAAAAAALVESNVKMATAFGIAAYVMVERSEEHTSELQSHLNLVCRLLLEKKKEKRTNSMINILSYRTVNICIK